MSTDDLFEITGDGAGGLRNFKFDVPVDAVFLIGCKRTPGPPNPPKREVRGCYPTNRNAARCYVTYSDTPFHFGELSPYDLTFESDIYPGEHNVAETWSVWSGRPTKPRCVSPPEWNTRRTPFRVRQSYPGRKETIYIEFCPIPPEDYNHQRAAKAEAFWHSHDNPPAPCTPQRVMQLVDELAAVVPATMKPTPKPDTPHREAPKPIASKYPEVLETYFAAMHTHQLDQIWNLMPSFSPQTRDEALATRKELTEIEKQLGGRVPRFPGNIPWASGLFPVAYRDGWGLAVDVASKNPGTIWQFWPPEAMIQTHESLCELLVDLIAAYRDGTPLDGYAPPLAGDTTAPWTFIDN